MRPLDPQTLIERFIKRLKVSWQILVLTGLLTYGLSFIYRLQAETSIKYFNSLPVLNWISFFIAVALALYILHIKRTYFRMKFFNSYMEELHSAEPELSKEHLLRRFTHFIAKKMKMVWILGLVIILVGVIYYWITFDAWNMHIYFIVGLYSLVINYPRTDLFIDVPYLLKDIFKDQKVEGSD